MFFVTETSADSAWFLSQVETPPGNRTEVNLTARGVVTFVFHETNSIGSVYTTCVSSETIAGSKVPET